MDDLKLAALQFAVADQPSESLPRIAAEALANGHDSPTLREVAGMSPSLDAGELADRFRTALVELDLLPDDEQEALWQLIRWTAAAIVNRELAPDEGALWIWRRAFDRFECNGDLRIFVGLASELEDHPEDRNQIFMTIVREAEALIERPGPRQWVMVRATRGRSPTLISGLDFHYIQLSELGIEAELRTRLSRWAADYDATFGSEGHEGFETAQDAIDFVARGRHLAEDLQDALGTTWHVEYRQEPTKPPGLRLRKKSKLDFLRP